MTKTDEKILTIFGQKIRYYRTERKLSAAQLAMLTGLKTANLTQIEIGKINLRLTTLYRIAKALDMHPCEVLAPRS